MESEFINKYYNLSLNDKRVFLNNELIRIRLLIEEIEKILSIPNKTDIINYNQELDSDINEEEYLTITYKEIFDLEKEILTIMTVINK